jgi:uncharacterized protein YdaU (DUF1376 family)
MSAPASMPMFGDAYLADTQHLTLEEHGAYFKLLLICWRTEACELPLDDKRLATMLGITPKKWSTIAPTVMSFWTQNATGWQQKRLTKERRHVAKSLKQKSAAANTRWSANSLKDNGQGDAVAYAADDANVGQPHMPLSPTQLEKKENSLASNPEAARDASRAQSVDASPPTAGAVRRSETAASEVLIEVMRLAGMVMPPNDAPLVEAWLAQGADPAKHIYPAVRRVAERSARSGNSIRSMRYLDAAVKQQIDEQIAEDARMIARFDKTIALYGPKREAAA